MTSMVRFGLPLLVLLFVVSPYKSATAQTAEIRSLREKLEQLLNGPALAQAQIGAHVVRLSDGQEIYSKNPDTLLVPASNVKIFTTAAALYHLGADYHFTTEVFGDLETDGTIPGALFIKGRGDPSIVPERLWYLATRLVNLGVKQIRGDIVIDDRFFSGDRMANGWEQDRTSSAYMAPMGAVSLGYNALLIHVLATKPGSAARILQDPPSDYAEIQGTVQTVARGRSNVIVDVLPYGNKSIIRVAGQITAHENERAYWRRIDNPPFYFGEVLKTMLLQLGIKVRGQIKTAALPEPPPAKLVTLSSPRLAEIVDKINKYSNNFMAEQIIRSMGAELHGAPADWPKAEQTMATFLENAPGIKKGTYTFRNGSGLHDVNRFTTRQTTQVLAYMYRQPKLRPEFVASLAIAGGAGTLAARMRESDTAYLLRAKTGTLSIASALSGYVTTRDGETLGFSIYINDYKSPIQEVWQVQDEIGGTLAAFEFKTRPNTALGSAPSNTRPITFTAAQKEDE